MSTPTTTRPGGGTEPAVPRNIRWVLLGILLALLLSQLDGLIVGTAMPTIVHQIGGLDRISWVVTVYTLTMACSTPVWGKLGDLYNRKAMFLGSILVFLAGSALSGTASTINELIAFRALQGIGAGGLAAGAFALIGALLPPRERGRYQGMVATMMALGSIGGPLAGGFITGHLGWRWAFYINLPIGVVCIAWCQLLLRVPAAARRGRQAIDWLGIAVLTITITAFVMAATWAGSTYSWGSWQIVSLAAVAAAGIAAFVVTERRAVEPLIPLRIFSAHRNFPLAAVLLTVAGVAMFGTTLYLPLFQQTVQGASATNSGILLVPMMAGTVVASNIAGKVMTRTGHYKIFPVTGTACLAVGMGLLATMDLATSRALTSAFMILVGIGTGFTLQMANTIAQNSVEMRDIGAASASANLFRTLGGSVGVAVFGSLFTAALKAHGVGEAAGAAGAGTASGGLPLAARQAYLNAVVNGTQHIFLLGAIVAVFAFAAAVFIKEVPLRGKPGGAKPQPAPGCERESQRPVAERA